MFLCIQNPGVAPVEGFTLLGVSTTRDCGVEGAIGQFGSGNKHAINVLLRAGLKVFVYCGKTRLDFQTRDDEIDDGLIRKPVKRVVCKLGGTSTRTIDLGWVLDFGAIDWTDLGMALREFVSNAIDRTVREENGEFIPAMLDERLSIKTVDDERVKAKDGYTGDNRSSFYFKAGVRDVLPELGPWDTEEAEETLDILYTSARCGLYHLCIAQGRLMTTSETASPVEYDKQRRWVVVNPHRLVPRLVGHLTEYTTKLRESGNVCLRQRFERWFDGMQSQDPLDKLDKSRAGQKHRKVRRHDC